MAKQSGLGDGLLVGGFDVSGDVGSVQRVAGGNSPLDVTGINRSAHERLGGLRDGGIDFTAWFNPAAAAAHDVLSALPTGDVLVSYRRPSAGAAGGAVASCVAKQVTYDPTRGADGSLTFGVSAVANGFGLEWGIDLGPNLFLGAGSLVGVDFGGSTSFGLQAYMHVISFSGTSATVAVQESADDAATDPYADVVGGTFAAVTAAGTWQRIATAANLTVERWLRLNVTGTFSVLVIAVQVTKNLTAPVF